MEMTTTEFNFAEDKEGQPLMQLPPDIQLDPANKLLQNSMILHRPIFAHVQVNMNNQKVVANAGNMLWMDGALNLTATCYGGCCASYWRTCAKESCCQNVYTGSGEVAFGFPLPGDALPFAATPNSGWFCTHGSFICGSENILVSGSFGGCAVCCCSGEGPFLVHITSSSGDAVFFAGNYGALQRHEVPAGKTFCVSKGLFFACSDKTKIEIGLAGGCKTCCCGHEGFVMKFKGPCVVYTQNRNPRTMQKMLRPRHRNERSNNRQQYAQ